MSNPWISGLRYLSVPSQSQTPLADGGDCKTRAEGPGTLTGALSALARYCGPSPCCEWPSTGGEVLGSQSRSCHTAVLYSRAGYSRAKPGRITDINQIRALGGRSLAPVGKRRMGVEGPRRVTRGAPLCIAMRMANTPARVLRDVLP